MENERAGCEEGKEGEKQGEEEEFCRREGGGDGFKAALWLFHLRANRWKTVLSHSGAGNCVYSLGSGIHFLLSYAVHRGPMGSALDHQLHSGLKKMDFARE